MKTYASSERTRTSRMAGTATHVNPHSVNSKCEGWAAEVAAIKN
jgi:hypothetical protein